MSRQSNIENLNASMQETLALFDAPSAALEKRYAPGKWSVREILVHLSDTETVLLERLRRIASEDQPVLLAFDQDRWAQNLLYEKRDLKLARNQYESARRCVIELAALLDTNVDLKTGQHSEAGPLTFAQILNKIHAHNTHHLAQANQALK